MSKTTIYKATREHFVDLLKMELDFYRSVHDEEPNYEREFERVLRWVKSPNVVVLISYIGKEAVGFFHVGAGTFFGPRDDTVFCAGRYVVHHARGRPVMKELWGAAEAMLREISETKTFKIQTLVMSDNETSARLVERRGFKPVGTIYEQELSHGRTERGRGQSGGSGSIGIVSSGESGDSPAAEPTDDDDEPVGAATPGESLHAGA